jgi:hypothetical protein
MKKIITLMAIVIFTFAACTKQDAVHTSVTTKLYWKIEGHELSGGVYYSPVKSTTFHN